MPHLELASMALLQSINLEPLPGETCAQAVERMVRVADTVLRPYRYEQVAGMRGAYQRWLDNSTPAQRTQELNVFQAGYTARGASHGLSQDIDPVAAASKQPYHDDRNH